MGKTSATKRVIQILKDLNDDKTLCVSDLALRFDTSERSIRRDFELIGEIFGDVLVKTQRGCYRCVSKVLLEDTLNSTELYMLKNILKLSSKSNLDISKDFDKNIKENLIKDDLNSPYLFKQKPYEEIYTHQQKFKQLEMAIKFKREIRFKYTNLDRINHFTTKPYKIVFISENFYLASEFKSYVSLHRIALISEIKETKNHFAHDKDKMDFIYFMQNPWATYKENFRQNLKEVKIQIPKEQAKYFKLKKFLPSQKIVHESEDGTITLTYTVSSENEVIGLIKAWIPYVKVIAPNTLAELFQHISKRFYNA